MRVNSLGYVLPWCDLEGVAGMVAQLPLSSALVREAAEDLRLLETRHCGGG